MWEKLRNLLVGFSDYALNGLKLAASFIVARVLAAFGLTWVTYKQALPEIKSFLNGYFSSLPDQVKQLAGALGVDIFMIMILSAIAAHMGTRVFLASVTALQGMVNEAQS